MSDAARPDRLDEITILDRRRQVAGLYLRRVPQVTIAEKLAVSQATVSADLTALRQEWQAEHREDVDAALTRDLAELDAMEGDCAVQFAATKEVEWITARLKIKERRARALGYDAPSKVDATSGGRPLGAEWMELRTVIMATMEAFPEARLALAEALDNGR